MTWRSFKEARKFVHALKLKTGKEWREYSKSGKLPDDIPRQPLDVYKNDWKGMGDWLGTGVIAAQWRQYRQFEEARDYVRKLGLNGQKDWEKYSKSGKKLDDIPSNVRQTYKNKGWNGWGDFLGTGRISATEKHKLYRSFRKARKFARSLKLKTRNEWDEYFKSNKLPDDIPRGPDGSYKNKGWKSWGNFLGTGFIAHQNRKYHAFFRARKFVHKLGLKDRDDWKEYCKSGKKPDKIPATPERVYKNKGWKGMANWLDPNYVRKRSHIHRPFEEAREFVHSLNLKSDKYWREYKNSGKKPDDIPGSPRTVYKKEWKGLGDWLGTGSISPSDRKFQKYEEARKFARKLDLKSKNKWFDYVKLRKHPDDIPNDPRASYKNKGWKGWPDFLGTGNIANKDRYYRSFVEARKFVHKLNLASQTYWKKYCTSGKKPDDIPANPARTYKKDWKSYGDWLGTGSISVAEKSQNYLLWPKAEIEIQKLGKQHKLKNQTDWREFARTHKKLLSDLHLPIEPWVIYSKEKVWNRMKK